MDDNLAGYYQHNHRKELTGIGREIRIADSVRGYCYDFPRPDTLDMALDDFAESYDFNIQPEEPRASISVLLAAEEYIDDQLIETTYRKISPNKETA